MAIHGMLTYRFPMILEEKNLRRIIKDLSPEHCDRVTYSGTIASGAVVSFPSLDKLFSYENSDSDRLVSLTIWGFRNRKTTLSITFDGVHGIGTAIRYREVCICEYEAPSEDAAERLKGLIDHFINTSKAKYWRKSKYANQELNKSLVRAAAMRPKIWQSRPDKERTMEAVWMSVN